MTFEESLRAFALHLSAERNLSPHTRRDYASDVRGFARRLGEGAAPSRMKSAQFKRM